MPERSSVKPTASKHTSLIAPAVVVVLLVGTGWYFLKPAATPELPAAPVQPAVVTKPAPAVEPADVLTAEQEPEDVISAQAADAGLDPTLLPAEQEVEPKAALPDLDQSDAFVQQQLFALPWQKDLLGYFVTEEMIRRFVVQVDNIAQGQLVPEQAIFQGLKQDFQVSRLQGQLLLDSRNYQRYTPYLSLLESVPAADVVALFNQLEPLLQAAFEELGYPNQQFRKRVQQAIQVLLAAPEIADNPQLRLDSVHYSYADEAVEKMSLAHKQMIRLGLKNQQRLKVLLTAYQPLLTNRHSPE